MTAAGVGAHEVFLSDGNLVAKVKAEAPDGIDHIVEVAFAANAERDVEMLTSGGTLATYATNEARPSISVWPMVFKNIQLNFLGSDNFPLEAKIIAAKDIDDALQAGWSGFAVGERIPLANIAHAHELMDHPARAGRIVVTI